MIDHHPLKRSPGTKREHDRTVTTVCQECATGCGLVAYVEKDRIVDVQGDENSPISRGRLCARGTTFVRDLYRPDRMTRPAGRARLQEDLKKLDDWEQALDFFSDRLKRIRDQHGPESLLIGCGPAAGLDFYYSGMRFAALWATPYLFEPAAHAMNESRAGMPSPPDCRCSDWVKSGCLFFMGADPATSHPVTANWMLDAQHRGVAIVVADTRFTATMSKADMPLRIRPESGNVFGMALMKVLLNNDLCSSDAVDTRFLDPSGWRDSFERMSLRDASRSIGMSAEQIREVAFFLSKRGPVQLITGTTLAHLPGYGIWRTMTEAMGWPSNLGGGWYPLDSGRPGLDGAAGLGGSKWVSAFEAVADPCSLLTQLLEKGSEEGARPVRALISSENCFDQCFYATAQTSHAIELATYFGSGCNRNQDCYHFLFPASLWAERDGLFFTNDRGVRWGKKIVEPPEGTRCGLDFWIGLARRFGWESHFPWVKDDGSADHRSFYEWLLGQNPLTKECIPAVWNISLDCGDMVYWPMKPLRREKLEPTHAFTSELAQPLQTEGIDLYPLCLESPRVGARTVDIANLWPSNGEHDEKLLLQINPDTARALRIETGDSIIVQGPKCETEARAWVSRAVPRDVVYATRALGGKRVLVVKRGQTSQEALHELKELLR